MALAVWLSEYGRPVRLARAVESAVEIIAGTPSVVLAIFGLLVFSQSVLGFLSQDTAGGAVTGQSFLAAGAMMALLALPLIVGATREGLAQVPDRMREASHGLGKTRATTIRHVLLPSVRPNIAEGVVLGMGRIIGDTAIVIILLGGTLKTESRKWHADRRAAARHRLDADQLRLLQLARGRGQRPSEGLRRRVRAADDRAGAELRRDPHQRQAQPSRPDRRQLVAYRGRAGADPQIAARPGARVMTERVTPPPVRRIAVGREPRVLAPTTSPNGAGAAPAPAHPSASARLRAERPPVGAVRERMQVESVWLAYGDNWVVRDVSLPVRQGEVLALIGASGSGKTTLLRSLNRLTEITAGAARAGQITLDGQEIHELEVNALRRRVSMVFQQPNPFPMSIFDNVAYALAEQSPPRGRRRRRGAELEHAVNDALRRAGLYDEVAGDLGRSALRLSGGQQQRLCIARALAAQPEVLLLDEPCSALDPISTATIEELIVGLRSDVAIVIVTHNLQQAFRVADHVAFMHLGELVEYGPAEQVFDRPAQQRTREYIGGAFG